MGHPAAILRTSERRRQRNILQPKSEGLWRDFRHESGQSRLNLWCIMSIYRIDGPPEYQHFGTNLACPGVILGLAPAQFPVPSELRPRVLSAKTP